MGAKRLAQTLVSEHLLSDAQVAQALQRQNLTGASLDTNLLELQLLPESVLLTALEKAYGVGAVGKAQLDGIGPHLARLFPLSFFQTYGMVPMRLYEQTLVVVACAPPDEAITQRLWEHYWLNVVSQVTTEARLHYAIQRVYGRAPEQRFAHLLAALDGGAPLAEPAQHAKAVLSPEPTADQANLPSRTGRSQLKEAIRAIEAQPDRDRAIAILIDFAHTIFAYVGVFVVHHATFHGWRSSQTPGTTRLQEMEVQLIKDSVLRTICEMQSPYLGPLPKHPANERFLAHIQRPWPKVACLIPVLVGGRLAALVYADNGAKQVAPKKVAALMTLLQRCGMAWERLIRHRKRQPSPPDAEPPQAPSLAATNQLPFFPPTQAYVLLSDAADNSPSSSRSASENGVRASRQPEAPKALAPTAQAMARWSDVIAVTRSAGRLLPVRKRVPQAVDQQLIHGLLSALDSATSTVRQNAMAQLLNLGSLADAACQAAFPGTLASDVWAPEAALPAFGRCSGLCYLLASRGHAATALVLPHLAAPERTKRLMAVYFFQAVHDPAGCSGLTLCLYDVEKRIRNLAIDTLRQYRNDLSYAHTVAVLRQQLGAQEPSGRRLAIQTLGQLREVVAVPALIPLLAAPEAEIARAAASALAVICGQSFGTDVERWQAWWQTHHYQPRPAWLLAGLSHTNPTIRRVAHHELQHLTGQLLDFDPQASVQEREQRAHVWQHWLQTHDLDATWHPNTVRA